MALATYYILCLLILFLMFLSPTTAQTRKNISLGSSLTTLNANLSWLSPSGDFAFGFRKVEEDGFLLAIWFNKISQKTIVWSANRDNLAQNGSKVELTTSGLFLKGPAEEPIWSARATGLGVAYAALLDTGNFMLANKNSANLWESFSMPTDTLLPTQTLAQGGKLVARYSETNYSSGRFHFIMDTDGNLALYTRIFPLDVANTNYWTSETYNNGHRLIFNQSGFIYVEAENGTALKILSSNASSTKDFYHRAILEYDGVFVHYFYPKTSGPGFGGWDMKWYPSTETSIPPNICTGLLESTGSGSCGYNSYCSLGNDKRPSCLCPNGYTFIDPNDMTKGCIQTAKAQSCNGDSPEADRFYFDAMEATDFPFSQYQYLHPVTEDQCRKACLGDCFCAAVFFKDTDCWVRQIPLRNGRIDQNGGGKTLIKVRREISFTPTGGGDKNSTKKTDCSMIVLTRSVLLSSSVFLNVLLLVATFIVLFHFKRSAKFAQAQQNQSVPGMNMQTFTYEELEKATNGFKEQLGRGAFGTVFKGVLAFNDGTPVAVKKLNDTVKEGEQEFKAEVSAIGRTHHKNLVHLIGYCKEGQHRLLVYEFMSNGSLASFLFVPSRPKWHRRMQIALEIARGLFYLHEECSMQIIHCDIKPQNILLDDSCVARISDFGLAKILKMDQTRTTTGIRGTKGYVAPEWFRNMAVTVKVDVYSFGILLLELICCRRNFEQEVEDKTQMVLAYWAYDCYAERKLNFLVENDGEAMEDLKKVEKYVMVAMWCIQEDPSLRPTMKKVVQMLEGTIEVSVPPNPTSLISSL